MIFDFLYLGLLCVVIVFTFIHILLPIPALQTAAGLHAAKIAEPFLSRSLPLENSIFLCILGLLYLKIIWRIINPPH